MVMIGELSYVRTGGLGGTGWCVLSGVRPLGLFVSPVPTRGFSWFQ